MRRGWTWLTPLGFDAGFGESVLSLCRRAAATFARPLDSVIAEICAIAGEPELGRHGWLTESVNGQGRITRLLVSGLTLLSGHDGLEATTLLAASGLSATRFRWLRAWCPRCVAEPAPYAPLVWSVTAYRVCVRHALVLQTRCGKCRRFHRPATGRVSPDACPHCRAPLSRALHDEADPNGMSRTLAELVANIQSGRLVDFSFASAAVSDRIGRDGLARTASELGVTVELLVDLPRTPPTLATLAALRVGGLGWQELALPPVDGSHPRFLVSRSGRAA